MNIMKNKVNQERNETEDQNSETPESVLKDFLSGKLEDSNLPFWQNYQERKKDSKISQVMCRLARKYLTPPPSSTDVERLFSQASLISNKRPAILPENLEKILFLRENSKKKTITIDY